MCNGIFQRNIYIASKSFSMTPLLDTYSEGRNKGGDVLWYSTPHETVTVDGVTHKGVIRSSSCLRDKGGIYPSGTCSKCRSLLRSKTLEMKVKRCQARDAEAQGKGVSGTSNCTYGHTNNKYLSAAKVKTKLEVMRQKLKRQRLINFRLAQMLARSQSRKRTLVQKIRSESQRGDVSAIVENLHRAYSKGCLNGKSNTLKFLKDITANMTRCTHGKKYNTVTKSLYEALRIIGGPRAARLISQNLLGPSERSQTRTRSKHRFNHKPSAPNDDTFRYIADIYKDIKKKKNICGDILVQTAEDETVIIGRVQWDIVNDECWGWCGQDGGFARVIMLNPLHKDLPPMVVLLQACCNTFTHEIVERQWEQIITLYNRHILPVLGPLVGHASDGDARRRKLHLLKALSRTGERYGLDTPNFLMSGRLVEVAGFKTVCDLADQDYVHNGKKLINHLKHASRVLSLGGNLAHMHHFQLVLDHFDRLEHGLQQSDVDREDRMNWESAQRLMFPQVYGCLEKINEGDGVPKENVSGTMAYIKMCWHYTEIFLSVSATLLDRVTHAGCVVNVLRIWRLWVHKCGQLSLKENFVSRETFQDISISCQHAVLLIKATRDYAADHPVCFHRTGTDVCEDYFSANGSFVLNKHNFSITDMFRNLGNMNRYFRIQ